MTGPWAKENVLQESKREAHNEAGQNCEALERKDSTAGGHMCSNRENNNTDIDAVNQTRDEDHIEDNEKWAAAIWRTLMVTRCAEGQESDGADRKGNYENHLEIREGGKPDHEADEEDSQTTSKSKWME